MGLQTKNPSNFVSLPVSFGAAEEELAVSLSGRVVGPLPGRVGMLDRNHPMHHGSTSHSALGERNTIALLTNISQASASG